MASPRPQKAAVLMKFQATIGEHRIGLDISREMGRPVIRLDDHQPELDLVRLSHYSYSLLLNGQSNHISIREAQDGYSVVLRQQTLHIKLLNEIELTIDRLGIGSAARLAGGVVVAPIPGLIRALGVAVGEQVAAGDKLLVLEAMKMENEITAPISGTVISVNVKLGNTVEKGTSLLEIEPTSTMDNS